MTSSRIPAVVTALLSMFRAELPGVVVYDGRWVNPPPGTESFVTVGWTPEAEGPTGSQEFIGVGTTARNEQIDIPCYIDAYSGSTDVAPRRAAAFTLLAAIEDAIRADDVLGGAVLQPGWASMSSYGVRQEQTEQGVEVGITFHITVITRI